MKISTGLKLGTKFFFNSFRGPSVVALESSNDCQASCIMCHRGKLERPKHSMSLTVFKKTIQDAKKNKVKTIQLSFYGEPLLDPEFIFKLGYVREHLPNATVVFNTNGAALSNKLIDAILRNGVNEIRFSIEGNNAKEYESVRKGLSHTKLIDNISKLRAARDASSSKLKIMVWALNLESFPISEDSFRAFWIQYADHVHIRNENKIVLKKKEKLFQRLAPCPKPFSYAVVLTDGRITICDTDWYGKHTYGSINEDTMKKLWFFKRMIAFRLLHLLGLKNTLKACKGCSYKSFNSHFQNAEFQS